MSPNLNSLQSETRQRHKLRSSNRHSDALVIGAGIIGLLTALELSESGLTVTMLDRQTAGREASFAGGGILCSLKPWQQSTGMLDLIRWSHDKYQEITTKLFQMTGIDPEYTSSGIAFIDSPISSDKRTVFQDYFSNPQYFDAQKARERLPNVAIQSHVDLMGEVAQIRNPKLMSALRETIKRKNNICLIENAEVQQLLFDDHKVQSVVTHQERFSAEKYIIATGAWTSQLTQSLGISSDIKPIKGQILRVKPPKQLFETILVNDGFYLIPRRNGTVLIGSTLEDCGFNKEATQLAKEELYSKACRLVPKLSDTPIIDHWAGLRPGTNRDNPIIDRIPDIDNAYICSGHFRYGLSSAPATAQLMADLILERQCSIDPTPYRFSNHCKTASEPAAEPHEAIGRTLERSISAIRHGQ